MTTPTNNSSHVELTEYDAEVRRITNNVFNTPAFRDFNANFDANDQRYIEALPEPIRRFLNQYLNDNNMIPPFGIIEGYIIKFRVRKFIFDNNLEFVCRYVGGGWIRNHSMEYNLRVPKVIEKLIGKYCISCDDNDN